ncbi:unnamed protein product [Boreogadus saida]
MRREHCRRRKELLADQEACQHARPGGRQLEESVRQEREARLLLANCMTLARGAPWRETTSPVATALEQEKAGGVRSLLEGTLRLRKLHDKVKVGSTQVLLISPDESVPEYSTCQSLLPFANVSPSPKSVCNNMDVASVVSYIVRSYSCVVDGVIWTFVDPKRETMHPHWYPPHATFY